MSSVPFGLPGEVLPYMGKLADELSEVLREGGDEAAYPWLDAAVGDGRLAPVLRDHIVEWNRLKQTDSAYVLTYRRWQLDHLNDWPRDGLQAPDPHDDLAMAGGSWALDGPRQPVRVSHQGRNEPCECGSGRKYKHCHGRNR